MLTFQQIYNVVCLRLYAVLDFPAYLLGINAQSLRTKLISRVMKGRENVQVTLNPEQAAYTRDALSKALYARLFDYLVEVSLLALVIYISTCSEKNMRIL